MRKGRLRFLDTKGDLAAEFRQAYRAETLIERTRGMLGRPALAEGEVFVINHCNSVHTFGMGYSLDLVYVGRQGQVQKIRHNVPPGRLSACWRAATTLELAAGSASRLNLRNGYKVEWYEDTQ